MALCFWGLLSAKDLEIIYITRPIREQKVFNENNIKIQDLIVNRSLYEFIHPEEKALAQTDLTCFLRRKTLLGAVTRCRLRSFESIAKSLYMNQFDSGDMNEPSTWNIVNVVTYSVTKHIVLAFFHQSDNSLEPSICGEQTFTTQDATIMLSILHKYHPVDSSTVTTTTLNQRTFQIYDKSLKNRFLSWPPSSYYHHSDTDKSLKDNFHPSSNTCMQHAHTESLIINPSASNLNLVTDPHSSYKLERIVINYGFITFYTFETTAIYKSPSPPSHFISTNDSQYPPPKLSLSSSRIDFSTIISTNNNNNNNNNSNQLPSPPKQLPESSSSRRHSTQQNQNRICYDCGRQSSLEWRRGPAGHKTLCNACGLRYSRLRKQLANSNSNNNNNNNNNNSNNGNGILL